MITEDYVSFEIAKLLTEKGFDNECSGYYNQERVLQRLSAFSIKDSLRSPFYFDCIPAPTIQMVMKWLRKEKGIAVVPIISSILDNEKFLWDIEITVAKTNETYHQGWIYESCERACEAAIKYCLENLI